MRISVTRYRRNPRFASLDIEEARRLCSWAVHEYVLEAGTATIILTTTNGSLLLQVASLMG
jgi:hypothetical protein